MSDDPRSRGALPDGSSSRSGPDVSNATDRSLATTRRRRFLCGLGALHPLVLAVAVALVLLALPGMRAVFASGAYTVIPESVLLRSVRDDFLHNSYTVSRLKLHPPDRLPIYVVGGSATRESIVSDRSLAEMVRRATGVPVRAYVLSNYNQTLGESLAIVDNLPSGRGIVVLAVNNNRFHFSPGDNALQLRGRPLLLESPTLREFVARDPNPKGRKRPARLPGALPGIMDYLVDYLGSRPEVLVKKQSLALTYRPHWITERKVWTLARKRLGVERWVEGRGRKFYRYYPYNARLLETLVARAEQRGFKVVFLEETENTDVVGDSFDEFKRVYKPIVRRVAAKYGVPYLDLGPQLDLPDSAFWDFIHPVEPARVVWERVLSRALSPVVREAGSPSSPQEPAGGVGTTGVTSGETTVETTGVTSG
ncbi:MAG TPA: SGNH/GDSL hydrolase family protein [Thermoleophilia bacterium]|nr:SGNH/GDSL hydrolase family protein [Thermoleophilia bacterium]